MGLQPEGMQPFALDGSYVVCNGEIYGFEPMKQALQEKGYAFQSGSDCEILLPLYQEYGTDMFRMLDAEFALILYDGRTGSYLAAGTIGIRRSTTAMIPLVRSSLPASPKPCGDL